MGSFDISGLVQQFSNPEALASIGLLAALLLVVILTSGGKQGKITTGMVAGKAEKGAAVSKAMSQIDSLKKLQHWRQQTKPTGKKPSHNKVTLWCGTPSYWRKPGQFGHRFMTTLQTRFSNMPTVFFPDVQRGWLVIGAPGSGKTYSTIDRAIESAYVQGIPVLLYDKKGEQMRLHAPLAARYGYKVHVFAPGEPYSGVLNLLEYMRSPRDSTMAGEIGQVINRNATSGGGKSDEFFSKAGDQLAKALLQLVKMHPEYADMATVYAILRMDGLVKRLDYAVKEKRIDEWIATSLNQFLASKDAEKTISGIMATAASTFSAFVQADLLRCFLGDSTIPKRIDGKEIIIFKLDDERRSVIGPLLAACIHMAVVGNLASPRETPILISLDELPSIGKLDKLPQWINEYRSNGGCFLLGIQSLNQLYEVYGDKFGAAIASACSTHSLFYPGDSKTAEEYSKRYGEKEVLIKNKSVGRSMGANMSRTVTFSESLQKMPLFSVDAIMRLPEGQCIITSPGYRSGKESFVPFSTKINVPKADDLRATASEKLWQSQVEAALIQRVEKRGVATEEQLTQALYERIRWAEETFPLPSDPEDEDF